MSNIEEFNAIVGTGTLLSATIFVEWDEDDIWVELPCETQEYIAGKERCRKWSLDQGVSPHELATQLALAQWQLHRWYCSGCRVYQIHAVVEFRS